MIHLVVINSGSIISGAEITLKQYLKTLSNNQFKISLLVANDRVTLDFFQETGSHIKIYPVNFFVKKHSFAFSRAFNLIFIIVETVLTALILKKLRNEQKIDIVYCNNTVACILVGLFKKLGIESYKSIFHIHDMMGRSSFKMPFKFIANSCEKTIAVSNACKQDLIKYTRLDRERIQVIFNGIEIPKILLNDLKKNTIKSEVVIGFAGSIVLRKGLIYLVDAYKKLEPKYSNLKLAIAYNLQDEKYDREIDKILINCNRIKKTHLSFEQMPDFYQSIDILVVPSLNDPFPTTILEALSYGKIVIGSNVDGIPEMLEQKYLFSPGDSQAISIKLEEILTDFQKYQLDNLNNSSFVAQKFSLEQRHKAITDLIKEIAII